MAVMVFAAGENLASGDVQDSEQRGGAVTNIVVTPST